MIFKLSLLGQHRHLAQRRRALWRGVLPAWGSQSFRVMTCLSPWPLLVATCISRVSFCPQDYVDAPLSIPDFLTCSLNIDWSQYQVRGLTQAGQAKGGVEGIPGACPRSPSCRYQKVWLVPSDLSQPRKEGAAYPFSSPLIYSWPRKSKLSDHDSLKDLRPPAGSVSRGPHGVCFSSSGL